MTAVESFKDPPVVPAGFDFDGVLMLTWSDWFSEPRSNRYHYGVRLARHAPVLFLQPTLPSGRAPIERTTDVDGLTVLELPPAIGAAEAAAVEQAVRRRGWKRILLWIYSSTHYGEVLRLLPQAFRLYHATEDYLTPWSAWTDNDHKLADSVRTLLPKVDLLVAVSERVAHTYREAGGYGGPVLVAPNGCDAGFFESLRQHAPPPREKVAVFQGGINARLDYPLLREVVRLLPDWEFRFCGRADESLAGWRQLRREPNVRHLGAMEPEQFGLQMHEASVGLIPFQADAWIWNSLPLKAYEYVACGLPVVTVPIEALERRPDLFVTARGAPAFAAAIRAAATTRTDAGQLALRREAAGGQSYDQRFAEVLDGLAGAGRAALAAPKRLNVLVLHGDGSLDFARSWRNASRHDLWFRPWTVATDMGDGAPLEPRPGVFDALVLLPDAGAPGLSAEALARFGGVKVLVSPPGSDCGQLEAWCAGWRPDLVCMQRGETFASKVAERSLPLPPDAAERASTLDAALSARAFHDRQLRLFPVSLLGIEPDRRVDLLHSPRAGSISGEPLPAADHAALQAASVNRHLSAALSLAAAAEGSAGPAGGVLGAVRLAMGLAAGALTAALHQNSRRLSSRLAGRLPAPLRRALGRALRR